MWKRVRGSKDEFGYEKGVVKDVYDRGGVRLIEDDVRACTVDGVDWCP